MGNEAKDKPPKDFLTVIGIGTGHKAWNSDGDVFRDLHVCRFPFWQ